ncbi:hypothetical protein PABY_17410 [Pyrodictium abyssi]|uniref:Uncharacterized protein n=1 Tax=Pyrodictium abyssi TaxID=54256 RepID=A0ABM8J0B1_9CREN|nr:hypothetical protein PABY_17410 [Pyrodictium abyssi]
MFTAKTMLQGRMLLLAALVGALLAQDSGARGVPEELLGLVAGGGAAVLAGVAAMTLMLSSGRFSEYCTARLGCPGFVLGLGLSAALAAAAASMVVDAALLAASAARGAWPGSAALLVGSTVYAAALMAYGYALAAYILGTTVPLILLLILLARALPVGTVGFYYLPIVVALLGLVLQAAACSVPRLRAAVVAGGGGRCWRWRLSGG